MRRDAGQLKLKAVDADDLQVIAGLLQDAIVPVIDMVYDAGAQRFVFAANRFRWELAGDGAASGTRERVHCGVTFANVAGVRRRGFRRRPRPTFLNLLTIAVASRSAAAAPVVELTFSSDMAIRLETTGLLCHLEDFGEPWPTQWQPRHPDS